MKIKSFQEACKVTGHNAKTVLPDLTAIPAEFHKSIIALIKLQIIVKATNGEWTADWNNYSQPKYYPWFWMDKPGFRFSDTCYGRAVTCSTGGSRLCFGTREDCNYTVKKFLLLYKDLMN